jgi:photosystem II stability/assembly factor-like uncharacterized protein
VAMRSATDGWAVGDSGTILHWDGSHWLSATSPTTATLSAVTLVPPNDGWAVGGVPLIPYDSYDVILRWNGSAWQLFSQHDTTWLMSVNMISPADGWGGRCLADPAALERHGLDGAAA